MKRGITWSIVLFLSAWLAGCANTRSPYLNSNLAMERWQGEVDTNPTAWTKGASRWFLTGDPQVGIYKDKEVRDAKAITTMKVDVSNFTKIESNGDFILEIFGATEPNTVFGYGPQSDIRDIEVHSKRGTLYINQDKKAKDSVRKVIVRVGVRSLASIKVSGGSRVEAIQLPPTKMVIDSSGSGDMYLTGRILLTNVNNTGTGTINVFGVRSPKLDITTANAGSVNVSGKVGINNITHHGKGNVNIIGADSNSLIIHADGAGKVGISGLVKAKEILATDNVSVLINCIRADTLYVSSMYKARVGLTGSVKNLYLSSSGVSAIYARTMGAQNTYVKAENGSHINATASNKIFISATGNGSVYFFGNPDIMTEFVSGNGVIIPVGMGARYK